MGRPWALYALLVCTMGAPAMATDYCVATAGNDDNAGTSPALAWRSIERVTEAALAPGDRVLFRRGDTWRATLRPRSGAPEADITYAAYGEGPKPLLLRSLDLSAPECWQEVGPGLWATATPTGTGPSRVGTPFAPAEGPRWSLYCENGAQAEAAYAAEERTCRIRCTQGAGASSDIQLYALPFRVEAGEALRLSLRLRASTRVILPGAALMAAGPPWSGYAATPPGAIIERGEWALLERYYAPETTADDARLTLFLGKALPAGAEIEIADLSLTPCDAGHVPFVDVGNLILGDEAACGVKVFEESDLDREPEYWYDEERCLVKLRCEGNPATRWGRIEAALRAHIIDQSGAHHVTYRDLCLKYGGAHGIGGGSVHHITIRDCDFGYIGGGDQYGGAGTVRFGNGIEFWGAAHDCLVEGCRLWEIYDAALTNQSLGEAVEQCDIVYRRNVVWNSEYSFEYWNRPAESLTRGIVFENNTCVNAGSGWSHAQRPDPSGRQICFYDSQAQVEGLTIRNNIFAGATKNAFYAPTWNADQRKNLVLENNLWFQSEGEMIAFRDGRYPMADFARYLAESGLDKGSIAADPLLADVAGLDFTLGAGSPCIDAGGPTSSAADALGTPIPQGNAPDIGAFERKAR